MRSRHHLNELDIKCCFDPEGDNRNVEQLHATASRTALGPTQPPIQWVPGAFPLVVKRPGREADHSPPSSDEVNNAWRYTSDSPIRLHGVVLS
jgi:hypothetical protein